RKVLRMSTPTPLRSAGLNQRGEDPACCCGVSTRSSLRSSRLNQRERECTGASRPVVERVALFPLAERAEKGNNHSGAVLARQRLSTANSRSATAIPQNASTANP